MKLTEAKINEAQKVLDAVMSECNFWSIDIQDSKIVRCYPIGMTGKKTGYSLAEIWVNRLHEMNGTEPQPL